MVAYDKPVTVGAYPKKAVNWDSIIDAVKRNPEETAQTVEGHSSNYVVNFDFLKDEKGNITPQIQIRDNLIKLKDAGTGFMCIQNDINVDQKFEKHMYALFDTMIDPDSRRYLSEDYTFCRLWQNMGGEVYLDPRTALNHVGHYTFRGNIRKLITG
jgi:WD40 repeat protein